MTTPIRVDLTLGALTGLAASAIVWLFVLAPPPLEPISGLVLGLALAAGAGAAAFRGALRPAVIYAVTLAALLVAGPALSCLAGCAGTFAERSSRPRNRGAGSFGRLGFRACRILLAAAAAAGAFALCGGTTGPDLSWAGLFGPLAAHSVAFAATASLVLRLSRPGARERGPRAGATTARRVVRLLPGLACGATAGVALSAALASPSTLPLVVAALALLLLSAVRRLRTRAAADSAHHARELAAVRNAVTHALTRTMEERDPGTQDHVRRVHRLSVGVAQGLGLSHGEIDILSSAALLHDIGKVGVPESILAKPGRLTPEEMEQVERHAEIGAEIVATLPFSEPLASIIRHHHERWDGDGYPDGLAGEEIPLGARIIAAVDCYDALTSDRPYRKALSHREATRFLEREAGVIFDSEVVYALLDYLENREPAGLRAPQRAKAAPAGQERSGAEEQPAPGGSLLVAQRELEAHYDLSRVMGHGLKLEDFLALVGCRLSTLVPHQTLVAYFLDEDRRILRAGFTMGRAAEKVKLTKIPWGQRISGWAASQKRAVVGRDHLEPLDRDGSRSDLEASAGDAEVDELRATLAAPLVAEDVVVGVLTLYDRAERVFTETERRALVRVAGSVARFAAREQERLGRERASLTDPLTGVPSARFLRIEIEQRVVGSSEPFGLLAFRVGGLERVGESRGDEEVDRLLCRLARRFAAGCKRGETLVRFGSELFLVLTPHDDRDELAQRAQEFEGDVEHSLLDTEEGGAGQTSLASACALYPHDGGSLDALLETLGRRLVATDRPGRTVIPFPTHHLACSAASETSA